MTTQYEKAAEMFGKICFSTDDYEVRARADEEGMHVFVFRRVQGITQLPLGFMMGHNILFFPKREV